MKLYQKFTKLKIDFSSIGFIQSNDNTRYFCTPKGAKIIGWAGVDGIHYCFIRGFDEMVFAVSPENTSGDYVHPIARNFEDLLSLLVACGSMDAIEQAHMFTESLFNIYLKDNPPGTEQIEIFNILHSELGITPMENPYEYIKQLQKEFDYSQLKYSSEYYDTELNPTAEIVKPKWKVTYDGGFLGKSGRAGKEISIGKSFKWGDEIWHIPSIYTCGKGLVVDFCIEVSPEIMKAYIDKWNLLDEEMIDYAEEREQIYNENPLRIEFNAKIELNGKVLQKNCSYGLSWIAPSCLSDESTPDKEAQWVLEHYNLDTSLCWIIRRCSFSWTTVKMPVIKTLCLHMERELTEIPGICFKTPEIGSIVSFIHPITGVEHTLMVYEYEQQELEPEQILVPGYKFPTHHVIMTYALLPELSDKNFSIRDSVESDSPKPLEEPSEFDEFYGTSSVGIIGGADGPTAIFLAKPSGMKCHTALSSLYFESVEEVEWQMVFREKMMPDIEVQLI